MSDSTPSADPSPITDTQDSDTDDDQMAPSTIQATSQSGNDERGTPTQFIRRLHSAIGGLFDLDPCSGAEPIPIAKTRFDIEDNGLAQDWTGYDSIYVNPPYSDLETWMKKVTREASRDDADAPSLIMCLLPGNTSTQWFHQYAANGDYLTLIEGRLTFHGTKKNAPFASILTVFAADLSDDVLELLDSLGAIYTREEVKAAQKQSRLDDLFASDGGTAATATSPLTSSTPTAPSIDPLDLGDPSIRDVSLDAPAVPQGVLDFYDFRDRDSFYVELDDTTMGYPRDVPSSLTIQALTGSHAATEDTQTPDGWHTVLCIHKPSETYVLLYQHPDTLSTIRCSVAPNGYGWIDVSLKTLHRISTVGQPAIDPYGERVTN
ncbi:DNA N-6-adenine-methyltransferase [Halopenitus sp. H-Gu1]|uniref:DNA N-6-adenine-methyltransferase n=1 Tax=Halopenitus sp. H-Gu1 TaxID=3242697 RepID=UPI00359CCD7E